jgi:predicted alpha/beta hydrolase
MSAAHTDHSFPSSSVSSGSRSTKREGGFSMPADPLAPSAFRELTITTRDGETLAGRHYAPTQQAVGAVLIVPAMAVPQAFYQAFATFLAENGHHVLSFDFRGIGASKKPGRSLRGVDTDLVRWAEQDAAAALTELRLRAGQLPITWVGHSFGGQVLPLTPNHHLISQVITVSTGSGYWRENAAPLRKKVAFFWYGFVPVLTPLYGYFPGKRLGMVGDLPRGVIRQWRQWCLHRDYLVGVFGDSMRQRYAEFSTPMTSFSFTDDEMMSERNILSIHDFYVGSKPVMRRFSPSDLGVDKVGHFGFFRSAMREPLWERHVLAELAGR